jgi:hypothetical protein
MHGSTKRGRSGRTGQMVRVLLQRQGVSVFEVRGTRDVSQGLLSITLLPTCQAGGPSCTSSPS